MNYGKWDEAEYSQVAFEKVKSGEWDANRFDDWLSHLICTRIRDELSDESM